jgi:hypothetical protein
LIGPWFGDAFKSGINLKVRTERFFIAINNIDPNLEEEKILDYVKDKYNIVKVLRIKKKSTNNTTSTVRLETKRIL